MKTYQYGIKSSYYTLRTGTSLLTVYVFTAISHMTTYLVLEYSCCLGSFVLEHSYCQNISYWSILNDCICRTGMSLYCRSVVVLEYYWNIPTVKINMSYWNTPKMTVYFVLECHSTVGVFSTGIFLLTN